MDRTYMAVLHNGRLEWMGTHPEIDPDRRVEVKVVISEDQAPWPVDTERAMSYIREIASRGGVKSIKDPVAWQREIRKDPPLLDRD